MNGAGGFGLDAALSSSGAAEIGRGLTAPAETTVWRLSTLSGRFTEICNDRSGAALTLVFRLVLEAQRRQEPVAWITHGHSIFFPPDVAETGVDLGALPVVRAERTIQAARAADFLLRSGAFGMVVMDIGADTRLTLNVQTRLVGLAKKHACALVCITGDANAGRPRSATPGVLGSLVSLRAQTSRGERAGDRYRCEVHVIKDKRRGPGWKHGEECLGPDGLC
ncbi:MAG: recombinase A [bacterium]|nr:recombinase A [bacterium]